MSFREFIKTTEEVVRKPIQGTSLFNEYKVTRYHVRLGPQIFSTNQNLTDIRIESTNGSKAVSAELLKEKINLFLKSLKDDFSIDKPKLAVLGLNPHAGESGLLGKEELEIIQPVIDEFRSKGNLVFGPYPADGFFGKAQFNEFDGVLGMYHDQGLAPLKYATFGHGVNITLGLPFIRTSVDHGTALDRAQSGAVDAGSMCAAIHCAETAVRAVYNPQTHVEIENTHHS